MKLLYIRLQFSSVSYLYLALKYFFSNCGMYHLFWGGTVCLGVGELVEGYFK
jgi:hypothetical protein